MPRIATNKNGGKLKLPKRKYLKKADDGTVVGNQKEQNDLMNGQNMLTPQLEQDPNPFISAMGSDPAVGTTLGNQQISPAQKFAQRVATQPQDNSEPTITEDDQLPGTTQTPTLQDTAKMLGTESSLPKEPTDNPALTASIKNRKYQQRKEGLEKYNNYFGSTGSYHGDRAMFSFYDANRKKIAQNETDDPTLKKQYGINATGREIQGYGHVAAGTIGSIQDVAGILSSGFATANAGLADQQMLINNMKAKNDYIKPYHGDSSQLGGGTNAAYTKFGGKLPFAYGGKLGYIMDHGGENGFMDNVITERNEIVNNTQDVFKETGDLHTDPSGGNKRAYAPGTVIHSASIGMKVGDMADMAEELPGGDFVAGKLMEKYRDPEKEISFADAAKLHMTDKIDNQIIKLKKKAGKEQMYATSNNETSVSQATAKLNLATLTARLKNAEAAKEANLMATGPEGPLHVMSEHLKRTGAYGAKIKNEAIAQAKYGKKLPKAGEGDLLDAQGYAAIDKFEDLYGTAQGTSMGKGTGYSRTKEADIRKFIEGSIGLDAWKKLPGNVKTQAYSWMFNHGADDTVWKGLAQAADFDKYTSGKVDMDEARRSIKTEDAIKTIKSGNFSGNAYKNYTEQVLPMQYQSIADNDKEGFEKGQEKLKNTWKRRPGDIDKFYNESASTPQNNRNGDPRIRANYPEIKYPQTTPTGFKYNKPEDVDWMNWQSYIDRSANERGFDVPISDGDNDYYGTRDPQALTNVAYQEQSYDDALDTPKGRRALAAMWDETGLTKAGLKKGIKLPSGKLSQLNDKDLTRVLGELRPAYLDSQLDYRKTRYIAPKGLSQVAPQEPAGQQEPYKPGDYGFKGSVGPENSRYIYREGMNPLQSLGPILGLMTPREATPFTKDYGPERALAATTRQRFTDIQPGLNRISRGVRAGNTFRDNTPVNQARQAQGYANAYEASNELMGDKSNRDAAIQKQYEDQQNQLMLAEGQASERALDRAAQRTVTSKWKKTALDLNSIGDWADRRLKHDVSQDASVLAQDMYGFGWNPLTGRTEFQGNNKYPIIGAGSAGYGSPRDRSVKKYDAQGNLLETSVYDYNDPYFQMNPYSGESQFVKKYGGKLKRLTKRVKSLK